MNNPPVVGERYRLVNPPSRPSKFFRVEKVTEPVKGEKQVMLSTHDEWAFNVPLGPFCAMYEPVNPNLR